MKVTTIESDSAPKAVGGYSQAMLVEQATRLLFVSGQIPETPDGDVPMGFESQCRLVWSNVLAQLKTAGLSVPNLIKITIFLSSREYADLNSRIRQEVLGEHRPALTIVVADIFDEKWLLEIEAIAAAA
ncbi:RidA family protein [Natronospirillum operosum]|uniref:RidA family protein n=1 Tax=Natronospirillum operosum TaxID=2759953 RepID=A0A4Z0WB82_9GAMM|nr:RidA family protein [Natronospirillum operosum]TGG95432.1 RidA family protein [Natronospirillum operosum]